MKKGNTILFLFLFLIVWVNSYSQIDIILDDKSDDRGIRIYNMENAELYIINEMDTFFVTKTNKYEFHIPSELIEILDKGESFFFLLKTPDYYFQFMGEISELKSNTIINICIFKSYNDTILSYGFPNFGVFANTMVIKVTKREKRLEFN